MYLASLPRSAWERTCGVPAPRVGSASFLSPSQAPAWDRTIRGARLAGRLQPRSSVKPQSCSKYFTSQPAIFCICSAVPKYTPPNPLPVCKSYSDKCSAPLCLIVAFSSNVVSPLETSFVCPLSSSSSPFPSVCVKYRLSVAALRLSSLTRPRTVTESPCSSFSDVAVTSVISITSPSRNAFGPSTTSTDFCAGPAPSASASATTANTATNKPASVVFIALLLWNAPARNSGDSSSQLQLRLRQLAKSDSICQPLTHS